MVSGRRLIVTRQIQYQCLTHNVICSALYAKYSTMSYLQKQQQCLTYKDISSVLPTKTSAMSFLQRHLQCLTHKSIFSISPTKASVVSYLPQSQVITSVLFNPQPRSYFKILQYFYLFVLKL